MVWGDVQPHLLLSHTSGAVSIKAETTSKTYREEKRIIASSFQISTEKYFQ